MQYLPHLSVLLFFWVLLSSARRVRERVKVIAVIDGDTVMVATEEGKRFKVRLARIDAPELDQAGGAAAKARLAALALGKWGEARWCGVDRYKRRLAKLVVNDVDVEARLVSEGLAYPMKGSTLAWRATGARLRFRGIYKLGQPKPHQALTRRIPALGWLKSRLSRTRRRSRR